MQQESKTDQETMQESIGQGRTGIYPGTFDPLTNGHLDIIKRALLVVNHLIIAVAQESNKAPLFSTQERAAMIMQVIEHENLQGASISVRYFDGLLIDFCRQTKAHVIIRGLRAVSDFEFEFQLSCVNAKLAPEIVTIFIPSSDRTQFISSRFVKEVARLGGKLSPFVPKVIGDRLKLCYRQKQA
jgi:pantetheine-phosphate adenylyltransferase